MGALFIVAAIVSAFVTGDTHPGISVVFETMDRVGVAFLLAGALFILQRHFVIQVQEVATRTAVAAADARIDERVGHVDARIDELGERMNQLLAEREQRQAEVVRAMDVPTVQTVANALIEANQLDALANGQITVQASRDINELGLTFSWRVYLSDGLFEQNPRAALTVTAHVFAVDNASGGRPVIDTTWDPDEPAEHLGLRLRQQLESRGRWRGDNTLVWPMALKNLRRSIDLAIRSRKRDPTGWTLEGALFELVGVDWAITEAGIQCRGHGVVLPAAEFPERDFRARKPPSSTDDDDLWQPTAPDWVDPSLWDELVRR